MRAYKFLAAGARSPFADQVWPTPTGGEPGAWLEASVPLEPCVSGVHVCRLGDLPLWLDDELWEVEVGGESLAEERQLLVEQARLLGRIEAWNAETARELGLDCMRLAQTAAVGVLKDAGLVREGELLDRAAAPEEVRLAGHAASAAADDAGERIASRVANAAGTAGEHMALTLSPAERPVAYAALSAYAATVVADTLDPGGYESERARQAAWLIERLELG